MAITISKATSLFFSIENMVNPNSLVSIKANEINVITAHEDKSFEFLREKERMNHLSKATGIKINYMHIPSAKD